MTEEHFINSHYEVEKISFDEYIILQKAKPYRGITNYIIDVPYDNKKILVETALMFSKCYFKGKFILKCLDFKGPCFFDNCYFNEGLEYERQGIVLKDFDIGNNKVRFTDCEAEIIQVTNAMFGEIEFENIKTKKIYITGGKFDKIIINDPIRSKVPTHIETLYIANEKGQLGNLFIHNLIAEEIYLNGNNNDNKYSFDKIQCDKLNILNFTCIF